MKAGAWMMSNVLDVKLPRKRIRIPFILPLTLGFFVYVSMLLFLSLGSIYLIILDIFFIFEKGEWLSAEEFLFWLLCPFLYLFTFILTRNFLARLLPGKIQIIAVKIVKKKPDPIGTFYWFIGGSIAKIIQSLANFAPPLTLSFSGCILLKLNFSRFSKKSHKILYLDEKRNIALAAEKCWGGGAVLLDEELKFLRLNKREKQQLLSHLRTQQIALTKDAKRLNIIIKAIAESRCRFGSKTRKSLRKNKIS